MLSTQTDPAPAKEDSNNGNIVAVAPSSKPSSKLTELEKDWMKAFFDDLSALQAYQNLKKEEGKKKVIDRTV